MSADTNRVSSRQRKERITPTISVKKMTIGRVTTPNGETIEIDTSGLETRLNENVKKYMEELKDYKPKEAEGKGIVESWKSTNAPQIVEELHS